MRKMASIQRIEEIRSIADADKICCYRVKGWWVVDSVNKYQVGDLVVYFEIDSWIPHELAPFLSKGQAPREFEGIKGEKLRTIRLRGALSQGLIMSLDTVPATGHSLTEDCDVTALLGIKKWEAVLPAQLVGNAKGLFPSHTPKTDQERVQNLTDKLPAHLGQLFEVTEKLEGTSVTYCYYQGEFGACSRNLELIRDANNSLWKTAIELELETKLSKLGRNLSIQGEMIGPAIQKNIYKLSKIEYRVFDIYDIDQGGYLATQERLELTEQLGLLHVPILDQYQLNTVSVADLLSMAEGPSQLYATQEREGIVFKSQGFTFKAISNVYLEKRND
jgi:RNA ligase (TIGR02306 family)